MNQPETHLVEVTRVPEEGALLLTWDDGHRAKPSYRFLCGYCPCARCQGHGGRIEFHDPGPAIEPAEITPVGNYAIHIPWKGGCRDGIYSFRFLRRICALGDQTPALEKDDTG